MISLSFILWMKLFEKGYKILILHSNTDSIFGQLPTAFTLYWRFFKELWWGSKLVTINTKNIEPKWNPPTPTSSARGLDFRSMAPSILNCNTIAWWTSVPNVLNILATLFNYIFLDIEVKWVDWFSFCYGFRLNGFHNLITKLSNYTSA